MKGHVTSTVQNCPVSCSMLIELDCTALTSKFPMPTASINLPSILLVQSYMLLKKFKAKAFSLLFAFKWSILSSTFGLQLS